VFKPWDSLLPEDASAGFGKSWGSRSLRASVALRPSSAGQTKKNWGGGEGKATAPENRVQKLVGTIVISSLRVNQGTGLSSRNRIFDTVGRGRPKEDQPSIKGGAGAAAFREASAEN